MTIQINNTPTETSAATLQALAIELNLPEKGVAVAVNNTMIPRTDWESHTLGEGAQVVIIKAACGG